MNNKGMTLLAEICIIISFALLAFFSLYIMINSFDLNISNDHTDYKAIEKELLDASLEYTSNKRFDEKTIITADTLKKAGLFKNNCNGYVVINNGYYDVYIKCGNSYETVGYTSLLAN